ncbi:MAG TPA: HAD-IIA family hydrolase [Mycobacteriales bacterium]|nr:HAD-IIA family hydrolase [Mycobacteriales bacterium]
MTDPATQPHRLLGCDQPLVRRYDVALLDLDGVVYLGHEAIPGVAEALAAVRSSGMAMAFVTNNASRTPQAVADLLTSLGVAATADQVVTSAQAGARVLAERLRPGSTVLVVGSPALRAEVEARGMRIVESAEDRPDGVIQGFSRDLGWTDLCEAVAAVRGGAFWVATNTDLTLPSPRGPMPGNGTLVNVVAQVTRATPVAAGKPEPALHRESVERTGARDPLVVGDRLDTDIEGAARAGCASLLVFSGVTEPAELLSAGPLHRPSFLARDVSGLLTGHPAPRPTEDGWVCGGWQVRIQNERLELTGDGDEELDALRALCDAAWSAGEQSGRWRLVTGGEAAAKAAGQLGLS